MMNLAAYAARPDASRGRRHPEPPATPRTEYQRDRDRIIHSSAFRRLEYKTQVFVNHEGDLFRTRLTHSLEVAQIARTLARTLGLNEDLCEAISLAHDLGHTPFGHAGQDALNHCMRDFGGFEHNAQSLRVVDVLEDKYAEFQGLNLSFETREGILKHCSLARARTLGDVGERFVQRTQPSCEAQLANLADEIAYHNHDMDDGVRAGLLTLQQLREEPRARPGLGDHGDGEGLLRPPRRGQRRADRAAAGRDREPPASGALAAAYPRRRLRGAGCASRLRLARLVDHPPSNTTFPVMVGLVVPTIHVFFRRARCSRRGCSPQGRA
mgnify:CR=1 FL=1